MGLIRQLGELAIPALIGGKANDVHILDEWYILCTIDAF